MIEAEKPHFIVPEIEAIATATLVELEAEGFNVIPTARATFTFYTLNSANSCTLSFYPS